MTSKWKGLKARLHEYVRKEMKIAKPNLTRQHIIDALVELTRQDGEDLFSEIRHTTTPPRNEDDGGDDDGKPPRTSKKERQAASEAQRKTDKEKRAAKDVADKQKLADLDGLRFRGEFVCANCGVEGQGAFARHSSQSSQ